MDDTPPPDSALVDSASRGDAGALRRLLVALLPDLTRLARQAGSYRLLEREPVADLVQSVCAEVLSELSHIEFRGEQSFLAYLRSVLNRKIADKARRGNALCRDQKREAPADDATWLGVPDPTSVTPSKVVGGEEQQRRRHAAIEQAIEQLPPEKRELIRLRLQGRSHAEIAEHFGTTANNSRQLFHRACVMLSEVLPEDD